MNETKEKKPISPILRKMQVGDKEDYPLEKLSTVKTICSDLGLMTGKVFSTSVNRADRVITVERVE